MPALNEGTLLYMPTTLPGISITKAGELLQTQDRIIQSLPGGGLRLRQGRAAPRRRPIRRRPRCSRPSINLKPKEQWRPGVTVDSLIAEMDKALQFPGVSNAWTMPIKARIDMLSTGIRTPVGVKVIGTDLVEIDTLAKQIEQVLKTVPGTSSAYAERGIGGYYLDITPDRAALARYGLMIQDVQDIIATALGGQTVTTTVEGRQRFTVNMRYPRDLRDNPQGHRQRRPGADAGRRRRAARRSREGRRRRAGRPRSGPRTGSLRPTSTSTSATATSAATSPTRKRAVQASIAVSARLLRDVERPVRISANAPPRG